MTNKGNYKHYKFGNDLDRDTDGSHDPDFDLDEYIRQQSMDKFRAPESHTQVDEKTSGFKNAVLMFLIFAAALLWANDWNPTQAWGSIFGSDDTNIATTTAPVPPPPTFDIPDIPSIPDIPEIDPLRSMASNSGYVNYMKDINEAGLGDLFPSQAYIAFYQSDISAEFITEVNESGYLDQLSFSDLILFHANGGDLEYLDAMKEANYLEELSVRNVLILQSAGIPIEFINELKENDLLDGMSYTEIIIAYNADN